MNRNSNRIVIVLICTFAIVFGIVFKLIPLYYFSQGQNYYKKQDYIKARLNFKNALFFNKFSKDYRYYYVKSLENLNPTLTIQKEMFEIASDDQHDSAQQAAQTKINEWRSNIISNIGDNYIEQAPIEGGIIRWDTNTFPLKIAILNTNSQNIPPYYKAEILRAFSQWQTSTGFINFETTDNAKTANITVEIKQPPQNICTDKNCKYVVGFTAPDYKDKILNKMKIILYANDPYGNFFSDKELYNAILHEIGHALGIMGHSYSTEDLMYMASENNNNFYAPYRSSFQYLSKKDINTIKLLYKLIPTITNTPQKELKTKGLIYSPVILGTSTQISSRKLKEAQNYIKNAPNIPGGYIDMGIAYAELNKTGEALKAMKKAYELAKSDNEKYLTSFNLAVLYMDIGNLDKAVQFAEEAQQISNNEDVKELLTNINHAKSVNKKPFKGNLLIIDDNR